MMVTEQFCLLLFFTENVGSGENLFEGDMRLNFQQRAAANGQSGRGSIRTGKWTGAVLTYVIDSSLGKGLLTANLSAIKCCLLYLTSDKFNNGHSV